jgi:hypothetical protein
LHYPVPQSGSCSNSSFTTFDADTAAAAAAAAAAANNQTRGVVCE